MDYGLPVDCCSVEIVGGVVFIGPTIDSFWRAAGESAGSCSPIQNTCILRSRSHSKSSKLLDRIELWSWSDVVNSWLPNYCSGYSGWRYWLTPALDGIWGVDARIKLRCLGTAFGRPRTWDILFYFLWPMKFGETGSFWNKPILQCVINESTSLYFKSRSRTSQTTVVGLAGSLLGGALVVCVVMCNHVCTIYRDRDKWKAPHSV